MEVKHPNASDGDHNFVRQQKAMQSHNRITGNYSKQALTGTQMHACKHAHTHTVQATENPTHAKFALPIWLWETGNEEIKLHMHNGRKTILLLCLACSWHGTNVGGNFNKNKPCSSMIKLVDVKTTTEDYFQYHTMASLFLLLYHWVLFYE